MNRPADLVRRFLDAVEARDAHAAGAVCHTDATWLNVPHPAAIGRDSIVAMLAPILDRSSEVRWDIVSESYGDTTAWLERVDRFVIDGTEYAVRCNGVFEIDTTAGFIREVRDYVDLGEWRARLAAARL